MLTANKLIPQGRGLAPALKKRAASVELPWEVRQRSRFDATDSAGRRIGVFLPRGSVVRGGDLLVLEDGGLVAVHAAAQPVLVVRPCREHGRPDDLLRAAYHLGNRHVAVELHADHLKLEPDPVLASMLRSMHLDVEAVQAAFEPESGAYAGNGTDAGHGPRPHHGHDHGHDHGPAHEQGPGHAHGHGHPHDHHPHGQDHGHADRHRPAPAASAAPSGRPVGIPVAAAPHVHGPGCGHAGHADGHRPHGD